MTMRRIVSAAILAGAVAWGAPLFAQKPASAPKNATAQCNDGTYSTAKTERGACSKHDGVKTWWGAAGATAAPPAPAAPKTSAAPRSTAASTAAAPKDATGQCTDGTYTRAKTERGACSQHGGVKTWFGGSSPAAAGSNAAPPTPPPPAPAPKTASPPSAQTPAKAPTASAANAPENATAKCKDGTYSYAKQHRGACSRHGGVAEWYK